VRFGRHCEEQRDEAIQTVAAEIVWIASAYALWTSADRSLALAVTVERVVRMHVMRKLPVVHISCCVVGQIRTSIRASRAHKEGRIAIITNVERGMRWTLATSEDE
jgi:hypothetical protein